MTYLIDHPIPPTPVTPAGGSDESQETTTEERESLRSMSALETSVREEAAGKPVDAGAAGDDLGAGADDGLTSAYWEGLMRVLERAPVLEDDVDIDLEPLL